MHAKAKEISEYAKALELIEMKHLAYRMQEYAEMYDWVMRLAKYKKGFKVKLKQEAIDRWAQSPSVQINTTDAYEVVESKWNGKFHGGICYTILLPPNTHITVREDELIWE